MLYGSPPKDLGLVDLPLHTGEMMLYLYLPILMANRLTRFKIPRRLDFIRPLVGKVSADLDYIDPSLYVYVTVKTMYVAPGSPGNRPGWHADGFGSDGDLNYIWYDSNPTEFCVQRFHDIPDDDQGVLDALDRQASWRNVITYPCRHLLRLDESVVHRVNPKVQAGVRTFVNISVSRHRYNLQGNSHNYLFDYDWEMHDRECLRRNMDNKDFKP